MEWKQTIYNQLQQRNKKERDVYAEIVKHCKSFLIKDKIHLLFSIDNRLIEHHSIILLRCTEQERDIHTLRQEKTDLEKNNIMYELNISTREKKEHKIFIFSGPGHDVNKKLELEYTKAKDEILTLLRERSDV